MRKAIMKRSELATRIRRNPTEKNKNANKMQQNIFSILYKKERTNYSENLDLRKVTDSKKFWKIVKPFKSSKNELTSMMSIKEGDDIV